MAWRIPGLVHVQGGLALLLLAGCYPDDGVGEVHTACVEDVPGAFEALADRGTALAYGDGNLFDGDAQWLYTLTTENL